MTKADIDNLFLLLEIYFPNSHKPKDKKLKNAWALVLEPYTPEDVRTALVEHLRTSTFFPDPQTIAVKCNGKPNSLQPSAERIRKNNDWLDKFLAEQHGWEGQT